MFIWDFVADTVLGQIFDWIYGKIVEFLSEFLNMMNGMGSELFELIWVQAVVEFFHYCLGPLCGRAGGGGIRSSGGVPGRTDHRCAGSGAWLGQGFFGGQPVYHRPGGTV